MPPFPIGKWWMYRGSKLNLSQSKRRDAHLWDKVDKIINPEAQYIFSIIKE